MCCVGKVCVFMPTHTFYCASLFAVMMEQTGFIFEPSQLPCDRQNLSTHLDLWLAHLSQRSGKPPLGLLFFF